VAPQESYNHNGQAASVTGGLVPPTGCGWAAFEQKYIYGDYNLDAVWTLDLSADRKTATAASKAKIADVPSPVSFRMGPDGGLYVVSHEASKIVRIAPKSVPAGCDVAAAPGGGGGGGGADAGVDATGAGGGGGGGGGVVVDAGAGAGGAGGGGAGGTGATGGGSDGCSYAFGRRAAGGSRGGHAVGLGAAGLILALAARPRKRRPAR
jgi:hypothetical protein